MKENTRDEDEEKSFLDKVQDKFYEKRSDYENFIIKSSIATLVLMIFAILVGSLLPDFFFYLSLPFLGSFILVKILATAYFPASIFFWKRKTEKSLEKPKTVKEKFIKYSYYALKYLIGFGFFWTLAGNSFLSLIYDRPVQFLTEGYSQIAVKLFICACLLALSYFAIVLFSYAISIVGFGESISKSESVFNLASKRSFVTFLGGFFVCFWLLIASIAFDSKMSVALAKTTDKIIEAKKNYQGF